MSLRTRLIDALFGISQQCAEDLQKFIAGARSTDFVELSEAAPQIDAAGGEDRAQRFEQSGDPISVGFSSTLEGVDTTSEGYDLVEHSTSPLIDQPVHRVDPLVAAVLRRQAARAESNFQTGDAS